jgi:hypothetical protein
MGRPEGYETGNDITKEIRRNDREAPVFIFCGAWAAKNLKDRAIETGVNRITVSGSELLRMLNLENKQQSEPSSQGL